MITDHQIDPWVQTKQHQVDHEEIPNRGKPFEEKRLLIRFRIDLCKLVSGGQQN